MRIHPAHALILLLSLAVPLKTLAQEKKSEVQLKLTNPKDKTVHIYQLNSFNYMFYRPFDVPNQKLSPENACTINFDLAQEVDPFLLKWVSGELKEADGLITMAAGSERKARSIAFTNGMVANIAESFMNVDRFSSAQLAIYIKSLVIDNIKIYKAADEQPTPSKTPVDRGL
jgi:hypothetical protein